MDEQNEKWNAEGMRSDRTKPSPPLRPTEASGVKLSDWRAKPDTRANLKDDEQYKEEVDRTFGLRKRKQLEPGKMSGGRIAAIVGLLVLAGGLVLAYFGAKSQTISSAVGCLPRSACTRANVELFLAGAAAVGAIIVYWSRPRG